MKTSKPTSCSTASDDDALHELTVRVKTQGKRLNSIEELDQVIQEKQEHQQT